MAVRVQIPVEVAVPAVVFDVTGRGYDRRQVDAHVAALEQTVAELRWEHDHLRAQREELDREREAFRLERSAWRPSFTGLGEAAEQILSLAGLEAAALVEQAQQDARRQRAEAEAGLRAVRSRLAEQAAEAHRQAEAELAALTEATARRRGILERELAHARRDAELQVTGLLARAGAQAQELLAAARQEAHERLVAADATVAEAARARDRLAAELVDLAARLSGVVERVAVPHRARSGGGEGRDTDGDRAMVSLLGAQQDEAATSRDPASSSGVPRSTLPAQG